MGRLLIGGVGYRWQSDASFGLVAADRLAVLDWPPGVDVLDLGYGAIYASQDIADARPPYEHLILVAATWRDRPPGTLSRYRYQPAGCDADEILARVREAGAGVIDLDNLLVVAQHLGVLPPEVLVVEVEPFDAQPGIELSPGANALLPDVLRWVRGQALAMAAPVATRECEDRP